MRKTLPRVAVYFENENQKKVYKKVLRLSKKTGMSLSRIGYLAMKNGLSSLDEAVAGISLDAQVNNQSLDSESKTPLSLV
jgi:hypothetical protein